MDGLTVFYEITTSVFAAVACLVAWVAYRNSRDRAASAADEKQIKRLAREVTATATDHLGARLTALEVSVKEARDLTDRIDARDLTGRDALAGRVTILEGTVKTDIRELREALTRIDSQGSAGLGLVIGRVAVLESKMEVFWKNVAIDVSKILHSPHPGWEDLDALLEKFQDESLSTAETDDLEERLRGIVDGLQAPPSITRADQVAASLLLRAIEQTKG
jgi:hypothetical protein